MARKNRLDQELIRRGIAPDRDRAARLVLAGEIWVDGQRAVKPDQAVASSADIHQREKPRFVSRGGIKLEGALEAFDLSVTGRVCADVGSSTGGFTDCLLQRGAAKVYAIDVGRGQLHWKLRQDPRVVSMERTDAREIAELPEAISLATLDASFISLRDLLPAVVAWLEPSSELLALVKPQFEARRSEVEAGGVVRAQEVHRRVLTQAMGWLTEQGAAPRAAIRSILQGPKGNLEYFILAVKGGAPIAADQLLSDLF